MEKKTVRKNFRTAVFERDGYRCVMCGISGFDRQGAPIIGLVPLDSHHIIDRHEFEFGGYVKENGISLCEDCHLKAEQFHISSGKSWVDEFHPEDLYAKTGSSLDAAIQADFYSNSGH